jgi:hypothetical protein
MKALLALAFTAYALSASAPSTTYAQQTATANDAQSGKWLCIIEKAAGVLYASQDAKEPTPRARNFEERHKKFVLTIKPIVRPKESREFCRSSLSHWMPILSEKGAFDPSDKPNPSADMSKFYDYRYNIGPHCFASDEATIKFFDRDYANRLVSYDFLPQHFEGLPGNWLAMYGDNFQAGETLDFGPVVFTGKCEQID